MSESVENHDTWFKLSWKHKENDNGTETLPPNKNGSQIVPLAPKPYDDYYNMKHKKRGVAVILNHKEFLGSYCSPRHGTEKDRDALEEIFTELGFEVLIYNDSGVNDTLNILEEVSKMDHSESDCLVVAVMTHGQQDKLYAFDGPYPTNILWNMFAGDVCPSLAAKPKLFFIQACRGKMVDAGVTVRFQSETDSKSKSENLYSIPAMSDILVMYSTVEGFYAWRDPQKGSPFIQSLVDQLKNNYRTRDILAILTFVNREVAIEFSSIEPRLSRFHNKKEMCSIVSMLTRLLVFE